MRPVSRTVGGEWSPSGIRSLRKEDLFLFLSISMTFLFYLCHKILPPMGRSDHISRYLVPMSLIISTLAFLL